MNTAVSLQAVYRGEQCNGLVPRLVSMSLKCRDRSFRPRWWGLVLTVVGCAAFIALGNWQGRRAEQKRVLQAHFDAAFNGPALQLPDSVVRPADYVLRRVAARGKFLAKYTVLLEDKLYHGRVGYQVITPLCLGSAKICVLVNRGWTPAVAHRAVPAIHTPGGRLRIDGLALARFPRALDPSHGKYAGRLWINVGVKQFEAWSGLRLQPIVIEQLSRDDDGLIRDWPRPDAHVTMNESYQMQWYSFAGLAVILFLALSFRSDAPST